ncbi:MAG: hypothetical protein ACK5CV_00965 [Bacteroidota bacterium]
MNKAYYRPVCICMVFFMLLSMISLAQPGPVSSVQTCDTTISDSGGENGPYGNNESSTVTYMAAQGGALYYQFTFFDVAEGDLLLIYDGTDTNAPLIASLSGTGLPVSGFSNNAQGALTFSFISDNINTAGGWHISLSCNTPNPCVSPSIQAFGSTTLCEGDSLLIVSNFSQNITWSNGSHQDSLKIHTSGSYWVIYDDGNNCIVSSDTIDITVNPKPQSPLVSANGNTSICPDAQVQLSSNVSGNLYWTRNGNQIPESNLSFIFASQPGTYQAWVTENGCSNSSNNIIISQLPGPPTPSVSALGNATACEGNSVVLVSSSVNQNQWFLDGNALAGNTQNFLSASIGGNYQVRVSASNGCSSFSDPFPVEILPVPTPATITANNGIAACQGASVGIQSSVSQGNWYRNNNPISGATQANYNALLAGNYSFVITGSNGCSSSSNILSVVIHPLPPTPTISFSGALTACSNQAPQLTSSASTGIQWLINGQAISNAVNPIYTPAISGNYRVRVTDANGCSSQSNARVVNIINGPSAIQTQIIPSGCTTSNGSIQITGVSGGTAPYYYSMNGSSAGNAVNFSGLSAGDYQLLVSDANNCTYQLNATVPSSNGPDSTLFEMVSANCGANGKIIVQGSSGGFPPYQYQLTMPSSNDLLNFDQLLPGEYVLTTIDSEGCTKTLSVSLPGTIPASAPEVFTTKNALCYGDTALIYTNPPVNLTWSDGTIANQITVFSGGTYQAFFTDSNNCVSTTAALIIDSLESAPLPILSQSGNIVLCGGNGIWVYSNLSGGNQWNTNIIADSIWIADSGTYWITQTNAAGCRSQSDTLFVIASNNPAPPVVLQNGDTFSVSSNDGVVSWFESGESLLLNTGNSFIPAYNGQFVAMVTNMQGCSSVSDPFNYYLTGLEKEIVVRTNSDGIFFQAHEAGLASVYDFSGRLLSSKEYGRDEMVSIPLPEGFSGPCILQQQEGTHHHILKINYAK